MSYTIKWRKAFTKAEINTVFCKMAKDDKQVAYQHITRRIIRYSRSTT